MDHLHNIKAALKRTDPVDWAEGLLAYTRYHEVITGLAMHYGFRMATGAAVFCELSPSNDYVGNLRSAATLMDGFRRGALLDSLSVTTFNHCKRRAWTYLREDSARGFLREHKGAPKITNFFHNICAPDSPDHITIDGHMYGIWIGRRQRMREAAEARWKYQDVAADFRAVAFSEFILPCQLQAILWFTWKRIHRIIYQPQMCLLRPTDQWHLIRDPKDIRPYKERHPSEEYDLEDSAAGAVRHGQPVLSGRQLAFNLTHSERW
jgi:hypothetical protein